MREIKFRGKDSFGNWQFGSLITDNKSYWTINDLLVDPKTIGQYIGRKDENYNDLYEGDILLTDEFMNSKIMLPICFVNDGFSLYYVGYGQCGFDYRDFELKGNIHDNPELLVE